MIWRRQRLYTDYNKKEEVFMKRVGIGIALLLMVGCVQAQFLGGIFDQGATEVRQNEEQIAAFQVLGSTEDDGYAIEEDGLTDIGTIHGAEFGLHQAYFGNLSAVNPAIAGMPEIMDIVDVETQVVNRFSAGVRRWQSSGILTAAELGYVEQVESNVCGLGSEALNNLQVLLTPGRLTMTDAERMERVRAIDAAVKEQAEFTQQFCARTDLLISQRLAAQNRSMNGLYGIP
jgi:hypothetical protein